MENIALEREIHPPQFTIFGEVVWVSLDEKNIHAFSEETGLVYIFKSAAVLNIVSEIDQIEDGQFVEMKINSDGEVVSARFIYETLKLVH